MGLCVAAIDSQPISREALTHYVIVRRDLPIGMLVAQTVHAAGESSPRLPSGTIAVALSASDELQLHKIKRDLDARGISYTPIVEGDGEYAGQLMAIGVEPVVDREIVRKVVSSLPLIK